MLHARQYCIVPTTNKTMYSVSQKPHKTLKSCNEYVHYAVTVVHQIKANCPKYATSQCTVPK